MKRHNILVAIILFLYSHHPLYAQIGTGQWVSLQTGACAIATTSTPGSCPQARHENGYVQVGDKFYLVGGRENSSNVNMYDPITKQWTVKAKAPVSIHHLQAIAYDGLIYVVGAFTGGYPGELPLSNVYIYNPLSDKWFTGPVIPRKRGASGAVLHNGKIYLVSGQTSGHAGGHVNWVDEFNPLTNSWRQLADIPNSRDHFHVTFVNDKMYAIAGRKSDYLSPEGVRGNTIAPVDVFDFITETWTTLPASSNIPTQRAGASNAFIGNEILVLGGESKNSSFTLTRAEAFNPSTQSWRTVADMITGRHASQAIVNNGVVYLAGGSPNSGGGLNYTNEAFYFSILNAPQLVAVSQSNLTGPVELDMGGVANGTTATKTFSIINNGISQAIQISSLNVTGTGFQVSLPSGFTLPALIRPASSLTLAVSYFSNGTANASGQLSVTHSGQNTLLNIPLKASLGYVTGSDENIQLVEKPEVQLYPNLVKDVLQIVVSGPSRSKMHVSIVDVMGRTQGNHQISLSQSGEAMMIDTSQLPGGVYVIRVFTEDGSFIQDFKIMKQ